ncbi:hypothetical protein BBO99_00009246 [Phytophthora kernoviae]|uniref:Uncharacterized protein n=2 Tax=Phytophthora kernoviae TaxID=325452 RepID=A0A3R7J5R0_9STRA|nr:hypothetical protein G195_010916 [Phytophthora kernoviae 00238/432]KAG2506606.1 hypothetical protein JM16_009134 [Phytophthora kernoviae]KAG2508659.1 hypothetical protein JM18_009160 [Phytophthora kernoviae]RLN26362.1 hypothetical protein BBI17_009267 [Phytophthora kernoviae]RLN73767.1 hypothetical protein BBO99_00009246 [Phytophthora kernoviae]
MHCHITDLDGIGALTNLQELYLQHNNVGDISPLTMHEELRVIDLEGNNIADIGQIEQLGPTDHEEKEVWVISMQEMLLLLPLPLEKNLNAVPGLPLEFCGTVLP